MREPLPGWVDATKMAGWYRLGDVALAFHAGWRVRSRSLDADSIGLRENQLAAEDAARAMVADMAAALGGSVTWNEGEVGDA